MLHAKKKSGQYLAAYAPYGYRKSEEDRHKLVIDGESAAVVRQIFQMRQSGMAYGKIAAALNEKGILPPRWYWAVHYGNGSCKYSRLWAYATVRSLLKVFCYDGCHVPGFNLMQHGLKPLTLKAHAGKSVVYEKARVEKVVFVSVLL